MISMLLLLAQMANADTTTQPCDHARAIYDGIAAKSRRIDMSIKGEACTINWTPKAGQTITFTDKQAQRTALKLELNGLETKLDDGTISQAETRRLLKIMLSLLRLSKDEI